MTNLPPIPKDRNWSPETWRAGLDEAVRLCGWGETKTWAGFASMFAVPSDMWNSIIAHATTLLDADIVKPVVSEADSVLKGIWAANNYVAAIAVIQSALDKARAGQ